MALASREVALHVGPPATVGYPLALERERENWGAAYVAGETRTYAHLQRGGGLGAGAPAPLAPVRWLAQPLLDGGVACRVSAHAGVTDRGLADADAGLTQPAEEGFQRLAKKFGA